LILHCRLYCRMKLLIIDNEAPIRTSLRAMVEMFSPEVSTIKECTGVKTGLECIEAFAPDIVLLDVEMDDGTGFDLLKSLDEYHFQLIFITAHNEYAVDAFRYSAVDYLLKPVDPVMLKESIEKAIRFRDNQSLSKQIDHLMLRMQGNSDQKIVLKDSQSVYFVKVSDILYCKADGGYTAFYMVNGEEIVVSHHLKEYEVLLNQYGFVRSHHSYLVQIQHIKAIDKTDGGMLILDNGAHVPVSTRKRDLVLTKMQGG